VTLHPSYSKYPSIKFRPDGLAEFFVSLDIHIRNPFQHDIDAAVINAEFSMDVDIDID
jgi:hypothetical protein